MQTRRRSCRQASQSCVKPWFPLPADRDVDTLTEVLWAALHGLTALARSGRLRGGFDGDRVDLLAEQFAATLR